MGASFFTAELEGKRLGLLRELVPQAATLAALINPMNANAENQSKELREAATTAWGTAASAEREQRP